MFRCQRLVIGSIDKQRTLESLDQVTSFSLQGVSRTIAEPFPGKFLFSFVACHVFVRFLIFPHVIRPFCHSKRTSNVLQVYFVARELSV